MPDIWAYIPVHISFEKLMKSCCRTMLKTHYFLMNLFQEGSKISISGSVADLGCLFRIPDRNFSIPDPGSKRFRIPDPHQKIVSKISEIIRDLIPDLDLDLDFLPIPGPGTKKALIPDPKHW